MGVEENLRLMQTLDDAYNSRDWETFRKFHSADTAIYWPGRAEPTRGRDAHEAEVREFCQAFPDNRVENRPYRVLLGQGEWTCSVAQFTGTMKGPMRGPDGRTIAPTNRSFELEFCTVAHWVNGEIIEEKLFYDLVGLMQQIGLMGEERREAA